MPNKPDETSFVGDPRRVEVQSSLGPENAQPPRTPLGPYRVPL